MSIGEIDTLTNELAERVRAIDETKLNPLLDVITDDQVRALIRRRLPKPSAARATLSLSSPLPLILQRIARDLHLADEPDIERRTKIFIGYCRLHNYSIRTVERYTKLLQKHNILSPDSIIRANRLAFRDSGHIHVRVVSMEDFARFVAKMQEHLSKYNAPILVAVYTGLRTFEILQWTTFTLHELRERKRFVNISRKQTFIRDNGNQPEYWQPVYNTHLLVFIDSMIELYREEYEHTIKTGIINRLFAVTHRTLVNRLRQIFFEANGFAPPYGFGIHSCRNMIATLMSQNTNNIVAIKNFLQHRNIKTTRNYISADFSHIRKEFDRLTKYELADVRRTLLDSGGSSGEEEEDKKKKE
nr:dnaint/rec [Apis mellifera nudivirus]